MIAYFLLGATFFYLGVQLQRRKEKAAKHQRSLFSKWPIERIPLGSLELFKPTDLGPGLEAEITFLPSIQVKGGISDLETWVLCAAAKNATKIFEFGTCTGKTTYLLARNSPGDAEITTLTLPAENKQIYQSDRGDSDLSNREALAESCHTTFYYSKTPEEKKICQLFENSKTFDETPYTEHFDLIFIDGSHAYSYVKSDTEKALRMVKKGGVIFWHDYRGPKRNYDVYRALNELAQRRPLKHIENTSLVILRADQPFSCRQPL